MQKVLINIYQALLDVGIPDDRLVVEFVKRVTKLDKTTDNGFSLLGDFVKKWEFKALQIPGLYITRAWKDGAYHCNVFELFPDGKVKIIDYITSSEEEWAVNLWPLFEQWKKEQEKMKKVFAQINRDTKKVVQDDIPKDLTKTLVLGGELGAKKAQLAIKQKSLRHYVIKYGICGVINFPHKVQSSEISDFPPTEKGLSQYIKEIADEFEIHPSQLPKVWQQDGWVYFKNLTFIDSINES